MDFKTKKIRKYKFPSKKHAGISFGLVASILIILLLVAGTIKAISKINFAVFLAAAGESLEVDTYDHTNFLILGTGGGDHEGSDLTDTIIVASLDDENKLITMLSIPRDIWVKDAEVGNSKINEVYFNAKNHFGSSVEGIEHMKTKVETIMGIPIHYWVKIDFAGFKELVDAIGGIDINVENAIYDPYYPKDGTFLYETFSIQAGQQHLDGETALKYARSRKTTSDFDRADRQQQIIYAIKEKALQTEIIFSQEKITAILTTLKNNLETNINVKELLTLGSMAEDFGIDQISHRLIHDDPTQCGGFLYTPSREFYNNLFVLIPAGGFEFLHLYADLNFNSPKIPVENTKIRIVNGTAVGGVAGENKQILQRFCFDVVGFGNGRSKEITQTTYYYQQKYDEKGKEIPSRPEAIDFISKLIPGVESTKIPQEYLEAGYLTDSNLLIEIGSDYVNSDKYVDDPFYYLPAAYSAPAPAEATPTETPDANQ